MNKNNKISEMNKVNKMNIMLGTLLKMLLKSQTNSGGYNQ
jgi:hypothetical protein